MAVANLRVRLLVTPTYLLWFNLIEPWRKTLGSLALKGFRFLGAKELITAIGHGA